MFFTIDWLTFFLALAVFVIGMNILNLIKAGIAKNKADKAVALSEKKYAELKTQLKAKEVELNNLLQGKG
jgi:hypothetical protein